MSTLEASLKELVAKVPNIAEEIRKIQQTPERQVAETVWVYNGFDDLTVTYFGRYEYTFRKGEVTEIGPIEHREPDQSKSEGNNVVWMEIHLPGESIAREIIETRGYTKKGLEIIFDRKVPLNVKARCDNAGTREIKTAIERFKVGREKAKAGVAGYKMQPDPLLYRWMQEHSPDDELFAEQSSKSDAIQAMARSAEAMSKIVAKWERPPRRKPLETDDEYKGRIAKEGWEPEEKK